MGDGQPLMDGGGNESTGRATCGSYNHFEVEIVERKTRRIAAEQRVLVTIHYKGGIVAHYR